MRDLIEQWLWMQAMSISCREIYQNARQHVEFKPQLHYLDSMKEVYEYAYKHFNKMSSEASTSHYSGGSNHDGFSIGLDFQTTNKGVISRYKDREVLVKWSEVKDFIEEMLTTEKQITMFELLLEGAQK